MEELAEQGDWDEKPEKWQAREGRLRVDEEPIEGDQGRETDWVQSRERHD